MSRRGLAQVDNGSREDRLGSPSRPWSARSNISGKLVQELRGGVRAIWASQRGRRVDMLLAVEWPAIDFVFVGPGVEDFVGEWRSVRKGWRPWQPFRRKR